MGIHLSADITELKLSKSSILLCFFYFLSLSTRFLVVCSLIFNKLESYAFALLQYQTNIDVISPTDDFSKYQLILAPSLYVVPPTLLSNLENFTANGGVLLLSFRSIIFIFLLFFSLSLFLFILLSSIYTHSFVKQEWIQR